MGSRMSREQQDWTGRALTDDTERRRRMEAEALAELARLVEAAEPAFLARPPEQTSAEPERRGGGVGSVRARSSTRLGPF